MTSRSASTPRRTLTNPSTGSWPWKFFTHLRLTRLGTRVMRFAEDPMFRDVVDIVGGAGSGAPLDWRREATPLVDRMFGGAEVDGKVHIVDLRRASHDLTPFILGSILELYSYELFRRGQENKIETLLVLEVAHHYLRQMGSGEEATNNSLAYERLAKEGRKFDLALWLSTQRPSEISPTLAPVRRMADLIAGTMPMLRILTMASIIRSSCVRLPGATVKLTNALLMPYRRGKLPAL